MKASSLGKLMMMSNTSKKFSINNKTTTTTLDPHSATTTAHHHHLDDLALAAQDMQDMRNCYDSFLSAAAATANSLYEFSESLREMGTCMLEKTALDADGDSGRVLSTLGNIQSELQKIADSYRAHVVLTITNPTESLLSELRKVEEMKLQCDEKREVYKYMTAQHKERGRSRTGKGDSSAAQKLQEAQDDYDEAARLCVFRVKSLKQGQCRSLLTQAARHYSAQLNFFHRGLKALEAVEPIIRIVAEKHRIDYQLNGLVDSKAGEGEGMSSYESTDDGELSFDYREKKQELDNVGTSLISSATSFSKNQGETAFSRHQKVSSYSAPLYADRFDPSERMKDMQPSARKSYSYVLPPPVDRKSPVSTSMSVPFPNPHHNLSQPLPVEPEKHEMDSKDDNVMAHVSTSKARPMFKDINGNNSSTQLPTPLADRFSLPQQESHYQTVGKKTKRQAYSAPLASKPSVTKTSVSTSGPITSNELPQVVSGTLPRGTQPSSSPTASRSASPPPLSSPIISELHELPLPPGSLTSKPAISFNMLGHSAPLVFRSQDISTPNKAPVLGPHVARPLPPPPLVHRSLSLPSGNQRATALHLSKLLESNQIGSKAEGVASPPLTPISISHL